MSNAEGIVSMLHQLEETGVKLSIDDFGTGNSCLSYLRHFPVYKLKVDRSFVREVTANPDDEGRRRSRWQPRTAIRTLAQATE